MQAITCKERRLSSSAESATLMMLVVNFGATGAIARTTPLDCCAGPTGHDGGGAHLRS